MRAVARLLALPMRRMPIGIALVFAMYLLAIGLAVMGPTAITARMLLVVALSAFAILFWHLMAGICLRGLCRPEALLLPKFRQRLGVAVVVDLLFWIALPTLIVAALGGHGLQIGALLLVIAALGLAAGCGSRATALVWLVFVGAGWMPQLASKIAQAMYASALSPLLGLLLALAIVWLPLRKMLQVSDRETEESPLQAIADGNRPQLSADGTPQRRGALARFIGSIYDNLAQKTLQRTLLGFRRKPGVRQRMALVRAMLLPHDNARAVALRIGLICIFVALYLTIMRATRGFDAGVVGAYAVLLAISRFIAVGQGMVRMRPNLADLYFTLAPQTRAEFQQVLADALLILVVVATITAAGLASMACILLHAAEPMRVILAAAITCTGASFTALAAHLIGPDARIGRSFVQFVVIAGAVGAYALTYWLLGRLGFVIGGGIAALLDLSFGIGFWQGARREYLKWPPRFDAPLA